ncbi:hypothetical protein LCGC14_0433030 [marine sediment metagenome]|uniref:Uncharacterized protein n=1 Tax=marine sediment metagenome TaxID=412755 RepID=A0A0F9T5Z8_9ZZZZ
MFYPLLLEYKKYLETLSDPAKNQIGLNDGRNYKVKIKIDGEKVFLLHEYKTEGFGETDDSINFESCEDIRFEHAWEAVTNSNIYRKCLNCHRIQKLDKMPFWEDIKK